MIKKILLAPFRAAYAVLYANYELKRWIITGKLPGEGK